MVGLTNARSVQDEKLIESIFQSHYAPESRAVSPPAPVFGATAANLIIDARPTTNAMANTAKGAGTENMDYYKDCRKAYLGIDNIHVMRDSLGKVVEALRETEALATAMGADAGGSTVVLPIDRQALRRSGWLKHISAIVEGTLVIVRTVHIKASHVLIHCSDGWDRTSQLSALSQLCLDPYYRTVRGFQVLIEKDWLAFGHRFLDRCGHLSSDKFFVAPPEGTGAGAGAEAAQAFFASVQNRFGGNHHVKETSPVFHQFLEAVRNVQRQFPTRFEFNELYLRELHYHLYSCQFGTFLLNSERERRACVPPLHERTTPVWDYLNSAPRREAYLNPDYDPVLDAPDSRAPGADQGVLLPDPKDVRFWHELYGRGDEDMNGRFAPPQLSGAEVAGPVESAEDDPAVPHLKVVRDATPPLASPIPNTSQSLPAGAAAATVKSSAIGATKSMVELATPPHAPENTLSPSRSQLLPTTPSRIGPRGASGASSSASSSSSASATQPDFFATAGGGLRSMWGRLSSNASTALSVVQDAYGGLGEIGRLNVDAGTSPSQGQGAGGELRAREELPAWGEHEGGSGQVRPKTYSAVSGISVNPWATTSTRAPRAIPSIYDENPWGTVRASPSGPPADVLPSGPSSAASSWVSSAAAPSRSLSVAAPSGASGAAAASSAPLSTTTPSAPLSIAGLPWEMPVDPTVAVMQPRPMRPPAHMTPDSRPAPPPPPSQPSPADDDVDPLGVGKL
jgi:myotubularin-related protein 6/7/8